MPTFSKPATNKVFKASPQNEQSPHLLKRLLLNALFFTACFLVCFFFAADLYRTLKTPFDTVMDSYQALMPQKNLIPHEAMVAKGMIIVKSPETLLFIWLKIALFGAALIVLPFLFAQFYRYKIHSFGVKKEWNRLLVLYPLALTLFLIGVGLAYFLFVPLGIQAFLSMQSAKAFLGTQSTIFFTAYVLDNEMALLLGMGLLFQFPLLLWTQKTDETIG